jgi:signal transduction histidine kinase/CHASE3 domain sensor protein
VPERRRRNRIVRRLTVFGPAGIVFLTGVLSYMALVRVMDTRRLVQHTHDVIDASSDLLTAMLDAETGQRGYLITHDTAFLAPYRGAPARADSAMQRLRALTGDNPKQQRRLDTLQAKVARRLVVIDSTVISEGLGDTDLSKGIVRYGPGRSLMSDIRRLGETIQVEEESLLVARREAESRSTQLTAAAIVLGAILAGLLAFFVNRNFDGALIGRRQALDEAERANEQLQQNAVELEHQAEAAHLAAQSAEEAERRAERLQAATEAFTSALGIGEVANLIVEQAMLATRAHSGGLGIVDRERNELRFVAVHNIGAVEVGSTVSLDAHMPMLAAVRGAAPVVATGEEIRRDYPQIWPRHEQEGVRAIAAYPLVNDGEVTGCLIVRFDRPHAIDHADRSFMSAMSRIAAETFERARLFEAERNARAAAESANRAKAAFLASMSHELRTPLQAALGFAQLVRSGMYGDVNEQQAEVLGRVERSQMHLARLIDDILDFARLEAGRVRVEMGKVVLAEVIGDLGQLVEPQAAKKKIELALLPPEDGLSVIGDRHRLQQILVNLVGNAIKFTPEGGTIRVGALADGDSVLIAITDTGMGIPADRLQAIFEPFVQVEDSLTRTASGAGLGLAISRDLARAMGGDMKVESELGKGSTFSVILPKG